MAVLTASRQQAMPWLRSPHTEAETARWIAEILLRRSDVRVAVDEGSCIVGFMALGAGVLEQLYAAPDRQGQGIGTALLAVAKNEADDGLSLYTFVRNARACRFYERHGFIATEWSDGSRNEEGEPDVRYDWRRGAAPGKPA